MINIFRSICFDLKRDRFVFAGILLSCSALIFSIIVFFYSTNTDYDSSQLIILRNGSGFFTQSGNAVPLIILLSVLTLTTRISGSGFNDHTLNYEILFGMKRSKIYLSRVLASVFFSVLAIIIFVFVPYVIFTMIYGWGSAVSLHEALMRSVLVSVHAVRFSTFAVFMTFLLKNSHLSFVCGYVLFSLESITGMLSEEFPSTEKIADLMSISQILRCLTFDNYTIDFENGREFAVYTDVLDSHFINMSALSGAAGIIIFLLCGYAVFRKSDIQ